MLGFFIRRTYDPEVAADLCAETFAAALVSRRRYRPHRGSVAAWLFGIAHHQLSQHHRRGVVEDRARRKVGLLDLFVEPRHLEAIAALEGEISAELLLDELPSEQAAAVRARVVNERSYATIALEAAVSEATVRQRVSRGLSTLRLLLARESS